MPSEKEGVMIVLSSPSGAGKTTLVKMLSNLNNFEVSISHTTRQPRPNEIIDKDYYFVKEEEFKVLEVAEKLKLQLKKLELIRLLSDQMLKRKRLGRDVFLRGGKARIRSIYQTKYSLTLFEILKNYSTIINTRNFQKISMI